MALLSTLLTKAMFASRMQAVRFSSASRELVAGSRHKRKEVSAPVINQDILLGTLKMAPTTENILELVRSHAPVMNNKHMMQALRSIFIQQKNGNSKLSTAQILKHPDFDRLCNTLRRKAGAIELNDTIEALKVVCYMGVSSNSTIVQVLLQLIRQQINHLSLHQTIFLDFLLSQMKPAPLTEALQMALPIIFEIQLPVKLDKANVGQLADCLQFVSKKDVSEGCVEFLVNTIMSLDGEIEPRQAMGILWSVCDFQSEAFFEPLFTKMLHTMIVHADSYNFNDLETTLSKMVMRYSHKHTFYYSDVFCDLCANYVIEGDLGFDQSIYLLRRFMKISHQNDNLLEYAANELHKDPAIFDKLDQPLISSLVFSLAQTEFRPKHWDELKLLITKSDVFVNSLRKEMLWMKLAASLCVLDIYKREVFELAMHGSYLNKILTKGYASDYENFALINQVVHQLKPEYTDLLPAVSLTQQLCSKVKPQNDFPLEGALQQALGGSSFLLTRVTSDLHHQIDHIAVLRKGGFPVAFVTKDTSQQLEQIINDAGVDDHVVAVMCLNYLHYTNNNKRMKGLTALGLKTLELKGCTVVPICLEEWAVLADFEKIPYLMQAITSKTNDVEIMSDSV